MMNTKRNILNIKHLRLHHSCIVNRIADEKRKYFSFRQQESFIKKWWSDATLMHSNSLITSQQRRISSIHQNNTHIMNISQLKQISLADFMGRMGHQPVKIHGNDWWYLSPLRSEDNPSFKINTLRNQWYDFGIGEGGDLINLGQNLYHSTDISFVLKQLAGDMAGGSPKIIEKETLCSEGFAFEDVTAAPLSHYALLNYLKERRVSVPLAMAVCKEVHYQLRGKHYFAIGFPNRSGGFELRNKYFKGCIAPKDVTFFRGEPRNSSCAVFEGFIDWLSLLTHSQTTLQQSLRRSDFIVLNSVANLAKSDDILTQYDTVDCYFDNDEAGRCAFKTLKGRLRAQVVDHSGEYAGHKDVNEWLCNENTHINVQSNFAKNE